MVFVFIALSPCVERDSSQATCLWALRCELPGPMREVLDENALLRCSILLRAGPV